MEELTTQNDETASVEDAIDEDEEIIPVTVIVAHPDASRRALFERSLRRHDEIHVLAVLTDVDEAVEQAIEVLPDVAAIPGGEGLVARLERLREEAPAIRVLVLEAAPDDFAALAAGAMGALAPGGSRLAEAVIGVAHDECFLPAEWAKQLPFAFDDVDERARRRLVLSESEREVVQRVAGGETTRDIADSYEISERLVNLHLGYVVAKFQRACEASEVLAAYESAETA